MYGILEKLEANAEFLADPANRARVLDLRRNIEERYG
jgi:hypothetical protein